MHIEVILRDDCFQFLGIPPKGEHLDMLFPSVEIPIVSNF